MISFQFQLCIIEFEVASFLLVYQGPILIDLFIYYFIIVIMKLPNHKANSNHDSKVDIIIL
jgi:hypothetical protein